MGFGPMRSRRRASTSFSRTWAEVSMTIDRGFEKLNNNSLLFCSIRMVLARNFGLGIFVHGLFVAL